MGTYYIFIILIIIVCFLLLLIIMVQNPKGGGLSSSFGGNAQQMGGVQRTTNFLDKSTWVLATILLVLILLSNVSTMKTTISNESKLIEEGTIEEAVIPQENTSEVIEPSSINDNE